LPDAAVDIAYIGIGQLREHIIIVNKQVHNSISISFCDCFVGVNESAQAVNIGICQRKCRACNTDRRSAVTGQEIIKVIGIADTGSIAGCTSFEVTGELRAVSIVIVFKSSDIFVLQ